MRGEEEMLCWSGAELCWTCRVGHVLHTVAHQPADTLRARMSVEQRVCGSAQREMRTPPMVGSASGRNWSCGRGGAVRMRVEATLPPPGRAGAAAFVREISHLRPLFWNRGVFTRAAALRTRRTHEAAQPNLPRCMALNSLRLTSELQDAGKVAISGLAVANGPGSHVDKPLRNTGDCAHASGDQKSKRVHQCAVDHYPPMVGLSSSSSLLKKKM